MATRDDLMTLARRHLREMNHRPDDALEARYHPPLSPTSTTSRFPGGTGPAGGDDDLGWPLWRP